MPDIDRLIETIESKGAPTQVFFRDDDVGWSMHRLRPLCERFATHAAPLDLALIPGAINSLAVAEINDIVADFDEWVRMHQHGYVHVNHQRQGRKCEFGSDRSEHDQQQDISAGQARLENLFGDRIEPVFTPPWNRCNSHTGEVLRRQGFKVLSRMRSAGEPTTEALLEVPVAVDWLKKKNGERLCHTALLEYAEQAFAGNNVVGIMLHHEHMDDDDLDRFDVFLGALARSPSVTFKSIMEVFADSANDQGVRHA